MPSKSAIEEASVPQLIHAVADCQKYVFLIGAGTSVPEPASIPTANNLIDRWREEMYNAEGIEEDFQEWVKTKEDGQEQGEYGFWFEQRHRSPGQRRDYIRRLIQGADPTYGHFALAALMERDYVPHVLTPNFDDVLVDAFYNASEEHPYVFHNMSKVPSFQTIRNYPAIVKLHGDYFYTSIQNLGEETQQLKPAMEDIVTQTAQEYGIVVVGYSGRDSSIMETLQEADLSDYGVYWCVRDTDEISESAESFLEKSPTYLVEIDGFVSLMTKFVEDIQDVQVPSPDDIVDNAEQRAEDLRKSLETTSEEFADRMEAISNADTALRNDDYKKAIEIVNRAVEQYPNEETLYKIRGDAKRSRGDKEPAIKDYTKAIENGADSSARYNDRAVAKSRLGRFKDAKEDYRKAMNEGRKDPIDIGNFAEVSLLTDDLETAKEKAKEAFSTTSDIGQKAISKLIELIACYLNDEPINDIENEYKSICEIDFTRSWDHTELNMWLEEADLSDEQKSQIETWVDLLPEPEEEN